MNIKAIVVCKAEHVGCVYIPFSCRLVCYHPVVCVLLMWWTVVPTGCNPDMGPLAEFLRYGIQMTWRLPQVCKPQWSEIQVAYGGGGGGKTVNRMPVTLPTDLPCNLCWTDWSTRGILILLDRVTSLSSIRLITYHSLSSSHIILRYIITVVEITSCYNLSSDGASNY